MEKAIKNKVAKAVVPAIDVMFQALRCVLNFSACKLFHIFLLPYNPLNFGIFMF